MLILSRRIGERVKIGEDVTATVLRVTGNRVHLGIDAPKHVTVHREEINGRMKGKRKRHPDQHAEETPPRLT